MTTELLLHASTKQHVAQFMSDPAQAILLAGPAGSGKTYLATTLAADLLGLDVAVIHQYPYFTIIGPDEKNTLSIDIVRELQHTLRLMTVGERSFRRVIIIEHAETMTNEAQNAFLKLLEEPPADTVFVVTAASKRALLPTILSRLQSIAIHAPDEDECRTYFVSLGYDTTAVTQAYFMGGGLPGLMTALLAGDKQHPLLAGVARAKQILGSSLFERLALADQLSKNKVELLYTLEALQRIAQTGLHQATKRQELAKVKQWHHVLRATTQTSNALAQNANAKLALDTLLLTL